MTNTEEIKRQLVEKYLEELGKKYGIWFEQQDKDDLEETLAGYLPSSALVRPLVWVRESKNYYTASCALGIIDVFEANGKYRYGLTSGGTTVRWGYAESLEKAKEQAEKHYTDLISSCLQGGGGLQKIEKYLKAIKPDFDKAESYQHGFHDAIQVVIDRIEKMFFLPIGGGYTEEQVKILKKSLHEHMEMLKTTEEAMEMLAAQYTVLEELLKATESYCQTISEEHSDLIGIALVHGWKSKRVEIGENQRTAIAELKSKLETFPLSSLKQQ